MNITEKDNGTTNTSIFTTDLVSKATVDFIHNAIKCYAIPIISALGIVGNVLSCVVFATQKQGQKINTVLIALAICDTCYIISGNLVLVECILEYFDPSNSRNFKILTLTYAIWISVVLSRISCLLTVVISVERFLVLLFPLRFEVVITKPAILITTAFAYVTPAVFYVPAFLSGEIIWMTEEGTNRSVAYLTMTRFSVENSALLDFYKNIILNILFRFLPMLTMAVCTSLTIVQLRRYRTWRKRLSSNDLRHINERDARITNTLVRVCVVFLACSTPGAGMLVARYIEPNLDYYGHYSGTFTIIIDVVEFFIFINSSVNFLIYLLGSDEFMHSFYRICRVTLPATPYGARRCQFCSRSKTQEVVAGPNQEDRNESGCASVSTIVMTSFRSDRQRMQGRGVHD